MMTDNKCPAYGALLLRVASGLLFLAHGAYLKPFVFTLDGSVGFFESLGLPGFTAYLVILGETVGGLMLLAGVHVGLASLWLVPILLGAVWTHAPNGWLFANAGGGWEFPAFWAAVQAAIGLTGPGAYAVPFKLFGNKATA